MNKPFKHTVLTLTEYLETNNLSSFLSVVELRFDGSLVLLKDVDFGNYLCELKLFCPSNPLPLHKSRRHLLKIERERSKLVGTKIGEVTIIDLFYGPDHGYKNRSFYLKYKGLCGHVLMDTKAVILKYKKTFKCRACSKTTHGHRGKDSTTGERVRRTPTYVYWSRIHHKLGAQYQNFAFFRAVAGDKPYKRAEIRIVENKPVWVNLSAVEQDDIGLIATALRQAFRRSFLYKEAIAKAKVETEKGTRIRCAACNELTMVSKVQVDHIDPVQPLDGSPLTLSNIFTRVWTDKIQVLDRTCHAKKSSWENKLRKSNRVKLTLSNKN